MRNLPPLPKFPGKPRAETPSRFKSCNVCGQVFDTERADHVSHHHADRHEPLKPG